MLRRGSDATARSAAWAVNEGFSAARLGSIGGSGGAGGMAAIEAVSRRAIAWLDAQRLPVSPQNYWLAYGCHDGLRPDLARAVDSMVDGGVRLSQAEADALYERFFARPTSAAPRVPAPPATDALRHQTLRLADLAASATAATGEFSRELASQLPDIGGADATDLQRLVAASLGRAQRSERELAVTIAEVGQLREKLETAEGDASRDALTGLPNRRGIDAHLLAAGGRRSPAVLAMCDLDRFKSYNDRYGHAVGDRVLRTVARSLRESFAGEFVGRWGGEEFLVVAAGDLATGAALIASAKADLAARYVKLREADEPMGRITFSAGVVVLPTDPAAIDDAVNRADALLYQAKRAGRDRVLAA